MPRRHNTVGRLVWKWFVTAIFLAHGACAWRRLIRLGYSRQVRLLTTFIAKGNQAAWMRVICYLQRAGSSKPATEFRRLVAPWITLSCASRSPQTYPQSLSLPQHMNPRNEHSACLLLAPQGWGDTINPTGGRVGGRKCTMQIAEEDRPRRARAHCPLSSGRRSAPLCPPLRFLQNLPRHSVVNPSNKHSKPLGRGAYSRLETRKHVQPNEEEEEEERV